jgi:hypothetical protein
MHHKDWLQFKPLCITISMIKMNKLIACSQKHQERHLRCQQQLLYDISASFPPYTTLWHNPVSRTL